MIGRTCAGIDEVRYRHDSAAHWIAEYALRGEQAPSWWVERYRDLGTDLRDMRATNAELTPGGAAHAVFGGAT